MIDGSNDLEINEGQTKNLFRHPGGRPSKFRPEYIEQAAKLIALGATDDEMANFFGVERRTFYRWQHAYPEFRHALRMNKEACDARVEQSLYRRAIGYEQKAVKIFMPAGASEPVYAEYREQVAPSDTAAIFWLKNRKPGEWREKSFVEDETERPDEAELARRLAMALQRGLRAPKADEPDA